MQVDLVINLFENKISTICLRHLKDFIYLNKSNLNLQPETPARQATCSTSDAKYRTKPPPDKRRIARQMQNIAQNNASETVLI